MNTYKFWVQLLNYKNPPNQTKKLHQQETPTTPQKPTGFGGGCFPPFPHQNEKQNVFLFQHETPNLTQKYNVLFQIICNKNENNYFRCTCLILL